MMCWIVTRPAGNDSVVLAVSCCCRRVAQHEELLWDYEDGSGSYFKMQMANMRQCLVLQAAEQRSQVRACAVHHYVVVCGVNLAAEQAVLRCGRQQRHAAI
jgi:hypothetical protein